MTLSEDDGGEKPTAERDAQTRPDAPTQKVEVVVIGDIYWDTVIVPLPCELTDLKYPESDNTHVRIERQAGAWLLQRLIDLAIKTIHDKKIEVKGYISASNNEDDLKAGKWGSALTVVKLFPKGVGGDMKKQIYRIKECYGWIVPSSPPDQRYPPPIPERYEEVFKKLNDTIKSEHARKTIPHCELWLSTMTTIFSVT